MVCGGGGFIEYIHKKHKEGVHQLVLNTYFTNNGALDVLFEHLKAKREPPLGGPPVVSHSPILPLVICDESSCSFSEGFSEDVPMQDVAPGFQVGESEAAAAAPEVKAAPVKAAPEVPKVAVAAVAAVPFNEPPLFDFQRKAVEHIENPTTHGCCLAYATGNGKTRTAIVAALRVVKQASLDGKQLTVIVVAPKSLQENFSKTLRKDFGHNGTGWEFYTYDAFRSAWRVNPRLGSDAVLICDEAHHLRTSVWKSLRSSVESFCGEKMYEKATEAPKQVLKKLRACKERVLGHLTYIQKSNMFVDPIREVEHEYGIDLSFLAPTCLCLIKAAKLAHKVILLTATPCYNVAEDIVNLASMATGRMVMTKSFFRVLEESLDGNKKRFDEFFKGMFVFADISPNDPAFPSVTQHEVTIEMDAAYYEAYHEIEFTEAAKFRNIPDSPMFYSNVRAACNALPSNSKVEWAAQHIVERHVAQQRVLVYSSFIGNGLKVLQAKLLELQIPFLEVTGSLSVEDRCKAVRKYNKGQVKVLFVSNAGGEGLDLKMTRSVIVFETEWNISITNQAVGRAPRRGSHLDLPPDERHVDVYHLLLVKPEVLKDDDQNPNSADSRLKEITDEKLDVVMPFLKRLRSVALCVKQ
jgi:superfamily II DNA or RNA helicase